jgi:hypothetical protein
MGKMYWKRQKTFAMLANRKQWWREYDPAESQELEIEIEGGGVYIRTETSTTASPKYIRTE